jgi:hypothetical protein
MSAHRSTPSPRKTPYSAAPDEAARLFLEGTAKKFRLGAIAVANEDGLLVFGSLGPASGIFDLEALAAVGPLVALGRAPKDLVDLAGSGKPVNACRLEVGGQTLFLTSVGPTGPSQSDAESVLRQILVA